MIIKGNPVTGAAALARYLQNDKNERVTVLEVKGTVANDLHGALMEMDAYAEGTRCEKALYHGKISPEPPYTLTREQAIEAADVMEEKLGLKDHARVLVMHEHDGRQHFHPIWTRIDLEHLRAVPDSHNFRKHEEAARELERRFGHPRVQGAHAERDGVERPERTPSQAELTQERRTGIKGKEVKAEVTALFAACDGPEAFRAALEDRNYILAKGDKRDFVLVDREGGIHSLAKRIEGMRAARLREFMAPIDREGLPTTEQAKEIQEDRAHGVASAREQQKWEEALAQSAVEKERQADGARERNARSAEEGNKAQDAEAKRLEQWDADLAANAVKTDAPQRREDDKAVLEISEEFVARDNEYRDMQERWDEALAYRAEQRAQAEFDETIDDAAAAIRTGESAVVEAVSSLDNAGEEMASGGGDALGGIAKAVEIALDAAIGFIDPPTPKEQRQQQREAQTTEQIRQARMERLRNAEDEYDRRKRRRREDGEDWDPDRQREVPGGGRTRSR